jgi:hypothetical protein
MATKELLGTNRGFELNNVTQFDTTGSVKLISFVSGTGSTVAHSGTYGGLARTTATDVDYTDPSDGNTATVIIITDPVYCAATIPVTASFWQRIYQDTLPDGGQWGTRTMAFEIKFYNAADEFISAETIATGFPTSTYGEKTGSAVTAPSGTVYARLVVTYTIPCKAVGDYEDLMIGMFIAVDDFSITVPGSVPRAMMIA